MFQLQRFFVGLTRLKGSAAKNDPVPEKLVEAIAGLAKDKSLNLGRRGYIVKRAKGKGARGFTAKKSSNNS